MKFILHKYLFFLLIITVHSALSASTLNTLKFKDIATLKIEGMSADIQFVISSEKDISITTDSKKFNELNFNSEKGILSISQKDVDTLPPKLRISIPNTVILNIDVRNNSHIFVPEMATPIKLTANDISEITIASCKGLSATLNGNVKVQIRQLNGDIVTTQSSKSAFAITEGNIGTAFLTLTEQSQASIAATIQSLRLDTKGASNVKLKNITKALTWTGRGNERISIQSLSGIAEVTANYDSQLNVESANLDTLFASTGSTGKIKVLGTVKTAALSSRGAGEIVIDKITGKILRKSEIHKGKIKVLNP